MEFSVEYLITKIFDSYSPSQKHLTWAKEKKYWTVAQWSKVLFSDESTFAFHLEIKVPESGGRVERHRIHVA